MLPIVSTKVHSQHVHHNNSNALIQIPIGHALTIVLASRKPNKARDPYAFASAVRDVLTPSMHVASLSLQDCQGAIISDTANFTFLPLKLAHANSAYVTDWQHTPTPIPQHRTR